MKNNHKTILFVEDNPLVLTAYRNRLQHEGFTVEAAEDGEAALAALPRLKPGLVILDLMLPKLNGMEVLKFIREHAELKETPVMILSNAYMDDNATQAMTAGATKRMLKTQCTPAKLLEAVRELLGMSRDTRTVHGMSRDEVEAALAKADQASLQEARDRLLKDAPAEVAKIREHCLAFVKAGGADAGLEHLHLLYQRVRFLCARAGLGDCTKISHLASALEAVLFEIIFKKNAPSASMLQTIAQAVDCLGRLFQSKEVQSLDAALKAKVLVVDDDPVCNFVTVAAMKRVKLEAVSIQDPVAALEMAQRDRYDILLLDIHMPGMDGFELCEKLRALPGYQKTPMIFVTSNSEFQNRAKAVLSGGNDLIAKPISPLELAVKTIMHLIEPRERSDKSQAESKAKNPAPSAAISINGLPPRAVAPAEAANGKPGTAADNDEKIVSPVFNDAIRDLQHASSAAAMPRFEFPAPKLSAAEPLSLRINPPPDGNNQDTLMKNQTTPAFDKLAHEVARIFFGDNLSEMPVRLTRIALERYNIPEIISGAPAGANGSKPPGGAALDNVSREVTRIMFGDDGVSEMHLRLTRIALERYNVPEIIDSPAETNWRNGSNAGYISGVAVDH